MPAAERCPCFNYDEAVFMLTRMAQARSKGSYYDPPPYEVWLIAAYAEPEGDAWLYSVIDDPEGYSWCSYFNQSTGTDREKRVGTREQISACATLIEQAAVNHKDQDLPWLARLQPGFNRSAAQTGWPADQGAGKAPENPASAVRSK
jgi:hypothetical protein